MSINDKKISFDPFLYYNAKIQFDTFCADVNVTPCIFPHFFKQGICVSQQSLEAMCKQNFRPFDAISLQKVPWPAFLLLCGISKIVKNLQPHKGSPQ
jgi:hypothetical protein